MVEQEGFMAKTSDLRQALTFDDVLLIPRASDILPREVEIRTLLTGQIRLNVPILSAAMDTVTESQMAIAMARVGGIGILHRNMSIEGQAQEVERVKRSESGVILNPVTFTPDKSLRNALATMRRFRISGLPIVNEQNKLLGILTERDIRFESNLDQPVTACMTRDGLVTAPLGTTLEGAKEILQKNRIEKLMLVHNDGTLAGMITVKDILKKQAHPDATVDEHGRLRVGAAIGATADVMDRVAALVDAHVDVLVVDSAHGHSKGVLGTVELVKKAFPSVQLIAGNTATAEGTKGLIDAGADAVKVGIGAGASCTTRIIAGVGVPQLTAVVDCCEEAAKMNIPVISDGGIRFSGDIAKAIAAGAHCVMVGSLLAGLDESPGEAILYEGRQYKAFRGMGSLGTMQEGSADRYFQEGEESIKLVPEGIEGMVPYRGSLESTIYQLVGGLRSAMGYCGAKDIEAMRSDTEFIRISPAGMQESHPHDVRIVKETPNYQIMEKPKD